MHAISQTRARLIRAVLLLALVALGAAGAAADDITPLPGLTRTALSLPERASGSLQALVLRPEGPGPFPLVLITHGMPRDPASMPALHPELYLSPAIAFAQRGYAVVVVMRRGYGRSTGPFAEALGPCADRDYVKAASEAAHDLLTALADLRSAPWVDLHRILLVGHSMGGFTVLAAAAASPPGVLGTISFAGGVGSPWANYVCQPDRLLAADRTLGEATHIPSLWLFARNDGYFDPDLAHAMFDAYTAAGPPSRLVIAPEIGHDGHDLIFAPPDDTWWPDVAAFLTSLGLPTELTLRLPPLAPVPPPDGIDAAGRQAFAHYVESRTYEKAFAVDPAGHYGVAYGKPTIGDAERAALNDCQRFHRVCRPYAAGNATDPP